MKKLLAALLLTASTSASAGSFFNTYDGLYYGNICRTGAYYSVISYLPIGASCWNYAWGVNGIVSAY